MTASQSSAWSFLVPVLYAVWGALHARELRESIRRGETRRFFGRWHEGRGARRDVWE